MHIEHLAAEELHGPALPDHKHVTGCSSFTPRTSTPLSMEVRGVGPPTVTGAGCLSAAAEGHWFLVSLNQSLLFPV